MLKNALEDKYPVPKGFICSCPTWLLKLKTKRDRAICMDWSHGRHRWCWMANYSVRILVPRVRAPFGQHQESRPLASGLWGRGCSMGHPKQASMFDKSKTLFFSLPPSSTVIPCDQCSAMHIYNTFHFVLRLRLGSRQSRDASYRRVCSSLLHDSNSRSIVVWPGL